MNVGQNGASRLAQHVKYLQRESAAMKTGDSVRFFGNVEAEQMTRFKPGEKRMFKVVLSPEEFFSLPSVDSFVHAFMDHVQKRAGLKKQGQQVDWIGYMHTNTPAPHIHLLIRGQDRNGDDLFIRRDVLSNLRNVGADIQNGLTGGLEVSKEVRAERAWTTSFRRLPRLKGLSIDEHVEKLPNTISYDGAMAAIPLHRRRSLHGRLIFLERNGAVSIENGIVTKQPSFDMDFTRLRDLQRDIEKAQVLRDTNGQALYLDDRVTTSIGLVVGVVRTRHHGLVAIVETVKSETLAVKIQEQDRDRYEALARSGQVVTQKAGQIVELEGDPIERLDKLRARGPVVDRIRTQSVKSVDVEQER